MTLRSCAAFFAVLLLVLSAAGDAPANPRRRGKRRSAKSAAAPPAWVQDAVFYHVFPERFRNGDPNNDPQGTRPWEECPGGGSYHGGDFAGIRASLDYLAELGVTALYLNPIHPGGSNHKYNPSDYHAVAPHFGTLEEFRALVQAAHERDIRVVLDGVFHHTGEQFEAFRAASAEGPGSRFWDWYRFQGYPVQTQPPNYDTFGGFYGQPKLNYENPAVRTFVKEVATWWIRELDVDGWRLDVAESVPHDFWAEFRLAVKEAKADAVILGEIWPDAQPWLGGDQFDSVTNYPLWNTCRDVFAQGKTDVQGLLDRLRQQEEIYRPEVTASLFNLLSSHDTERFLTLCGGDRRKLLLAYTFLFTTRGAPVIYYGDELGLEGGRDPDNRRCFPWNELDRRGETLATFRRLGRLRGQLQELRRGELTVWFADPAQGILVFERRLKRARTVVVLNTSGEPRTVDLSASRGGWRRGARVREMLSGGTMRVGASTMRLPLEPFQALILR